jgi:hypothetical protein
MCGVPASKCRTPRVLITSCNTPASPLTEQQENKMNVWLSSQAVARLTDLLAVAATTPHTGDQQRRQVDSGRRQVKELMPASELLVLAGVLREAADRAGLSAATRTDCWSWSSYLERLLAGSPTGTAATIQPVTRVRPTRNAVLVPSVDDGPVEVASPGRDAPSPCDDAPGQAANVA